MRGVYKKMWSLIECKRQDLCRGKSAEFEEAWYCKVWYELHISREIGESTRLVSFNQAQMEFEKFWKYDINSLDETNVLMVIFCYAIVMDTVRP